MTLDRRRIAARADLAAESLRGRVDAARFVAGRAMRIAAETADLRSGPHVSATRDTQALHGEDVTVYEEANGWAWLQLKQDGYVGYLRASALSDRVPTLTHRLSVPRSFVYASASIKDRVLRALPMGAGLSCSEAEGAFLAVEGGGYVFASHVMEINAFERDFVEIAERFRNAPYLWGGKTWSGLDCSGLVQLALARAGVDAPRDTDMMAAELGSPINLADLSTLRRGDLVFWSGHVGIMQDERQLLHANGHHMQVVSEPLEQAAARISRAGAGPITTVRRISAPHNPSANG